MPSLLIPRPMRELLQLLGSARYSKWTLSSLTSAAVPTTFFDSQATVLFWMGQRKTDSARGFRMGFSGNRTNGPSPHSGTPLASVWSSTASGLVSAGPAVPNIANATIPSSPHFMLHLIQLQFSSRNLL